ncbi:MAG TPA: hypothetical protein VK806_05770, partial [Bacteroidia bacterium]|nr:hypothetical protein [Bacteroidia bacterium]
AELMQNDITLNVRIVNGDSSVSYHPVGLGVLVSPYHARPIFQDYFVYPQGDISAVNAEMELSVTSPNPNYNYTLEIQYDRSVGMVDL